MKPIDATKALSAALLALFIPISTIHAAQAPELIAAVKAGDTASVMAHLQTPGAAQARDERGNTALHWAALANDARLVSVLLAAGVDARVTNSAGATPLHYGTGNEQIVGDLLRAGADPNAKSHAGATALHTAAARPDGYRSVEMLLDAGAEIDAPRSLFPKGVSFPGVIGPLALAIYFGDARSVALLIDRGAALDNDAGSTPVSVAAFSGRANWVAELVKRGAKVNFDEGFVGHALNNLLYAGHRRFVGLVIEHGSDLNQTSSIGEKVPPIVWSAYTETADVTAAEALLAKGVDINTTTSAGHTALDWALKRGETPLVAYLRARGATTGTSVTQAKTAPQNAVPSDAASRTSALRDSVQRAVDLLQRGSDGFLANGFVKQSGCISCHHQTLPAVAYGRARERGFQLDETALARQLHTQHASWSKSLDAAYEMFEPQPDSPATLGYGLFGLKSVGYAPDELTEAMVWYLASSQLSDGSFPGFDRRPPLEEGQIVATAFAVGALRNYPQPLKAVDVDRTVAKARDWLLKFEPADPNQQLHWLLGLGWAGAKPAELDEAAREILSAQRADGGWAPLPTLGSDAWATGLTLFVLHEVGGVAASDDHYRRGVDFLLRTQYADGSWCVPSRTWPLQPHFDSGFPHGKDQWISAAGTAWAVIALLNEIEPIAKRESFATAQQLMAKYPEQAVESQKAASEPATATIAAPAADRAFTHDILPIFQKSCVACHGGDEPEGDLSVESVAGLLKGGQSGEPAIVPGKPEASQLLRYVNDEVEDLEMPPLSERAKYPALSQDDIQQLREWIAKSVD